MLKKIVKFLRKSKTGDNVIVFLILTAIMAVIAVTVSTNIKNELIGDDGVLDVVIDQIEDMSTAIEGSGD